MTDNEDDKLNTFLDGFSKPVEPNRIRMASSQLNEPESTIDQIRRRRRQEHWKFTVPLALIAGFFGIRILTAAISPGIGRNSISMMNLGVTIVAAMIAFLAYAKSTEGEKEERPKGSDQP